MTRRTLLVAPLAQDILERIPNPADQRISYGTDPQQFGDLRLPRGKGPFPLVINIHGGFWKAAYNLEHNGHLCEALAAKGIATWSIEYRRVGNPGGGYPGTLDDVRAAAGFARQLAPGHPLDLKRVIAMGHSAGGHLALWLGREIPWLKGVVALAPVADTERARELKLGSGAVDNFIRENHKVISPLERLPLGKPVALIHGEADTVVPKEISERYLKAALQAKDKVTLDILPGGHFELIDPQTTQWATVEKRVLELLAG